MQVGNFSNVSFCFLNQNNGFLKYPSSLNSSMQLLWLIGMLFYAQLPSCVWLFVTPLTAAHPASLAFTVSWSSLKFISVRSHSYILDDYISVYLLFLWLYITPWILYIQFVFLFFWPFRELFLTSVKYGSLV